MSRLAMLGAAACLSLVLTAAPPDKVNASAAVLQDFSARLDAYMKLRKPLLEKLKPTNSPTAIVEHRHNLAAAIRAARPQAAQGDIFTAEIGTEFQRLVAMAMQGSRAHRVRQSLKRAEPVRLHLKVNDTYPTAMPLQSTPPTLLANLPPLPPKIDYRVIGQDLVLHDSEANIIIDFVPNAIP